MDFSHKNIEDHTLNNIVTQNKTIKKDLRKHGAFMTFIYSPFLEI